MSFASSTRRVTATRQASRALCLGLIALATGVAESRDLEWEVAAAYASSGIRPPGFPPDAYVLRNSQLGVGGRLSFELVTDTHSATLWTQTGEGDVRPLARQVVADGLGPGRGGSEAGHVFNTLWGQHYSTRTGAQLFLGLAGPVGQVNTTPGLWLNDGVRNIELARADTDGALGPNLGPGITLIGTTGNGNLALGRLQVLPDDALALEADINAPSRKDVILQRRYAGSFSACALEGSADPSLAPGVSAPDADQFVELSGLARDAGGELYSYGAVRLFVVSPTRVGIWRVCAGPPAARALTGNRAALGPGIAGSPLAEFFSFSGELSPLGGNTLLFFARARLDGSTSTSPLVDGLFFNDGQGNRPILILGQGGALGPGVANHSFRRLDSFKGEGFAALLAEVRENGSTLDRAGLWRLAAGRAPEPLALVGDNGALAPGQGLTWQSFDDARALANGDVLAVATTRSNAVDTRALWRFRPGRGPERLFGPGDSVRYRDSSGQPRSGTVARIEPLSGTQLPRYAGDEGWINAEGDVMLLGQLQNNPARLVFQNSAALLDRDALFSDGFEP